MPPKMFTQGLGPIKDLELVMAVDDYFKTTESSCNEGDLVRAQFAEECAKVYKVKLKASLAFDNNDRFQVIADSRAHVFSRSDIWEKRSTANKEFLTRCLPQAAALYQAQGRNLAKVGDCHLLKGTKLGLTYLNRKEGTFFHVWASCTQARLYANTQQWAWQAIFEHRVTSLSVPVSGFYTFGSHHVTATSLVPLLSSDAVKPAKNSVLAFGIQALEDATRNTVSQVMQGADGRFYVLKLGGIMLRSFPASNPVLRREGLNHLKDTDELDEETVQARVCSIGVEKCALGLLKHVIDKGDAAKISDLVSEQVVAHHMRLHGVNMRFLYALRYSKVLQGGTTKKSSSDMSKMKHQGLVKEAIDLEMICRALKLLVRAENAASPTDDEQLRMDRVNRLMGALAENNPSVWTIISNICTKKFDLPEDYIVAPAPQHVRYVTFFMSKKYGLAFDPAQAKFTKTNPVMPFSTFYVACEAMKLSLSKSDELASYLTTMWDEAHSTSDMRLRTVRCLRVAFIECLVRWGVKVDEHTQAIDGMLSAADEPVPMVVKGILADFLDPKVVDQNPMLQQNVKDVANFKPPSKGDSFSGGRLTDGLLYKASRLITFGHYRKNAKNTADGILLGVPLVDCGMNRTHLQTVVEALTDPMTVTPPIAKTCIAALVHATTAMGAAKTLLKAFVAVTARACTPDGSTCSEFGDVGDLADKYHLHTASMAPPKHPNCVCVLSCACSIVLSVPRHHSNHPPTDDVLKLCQGVSLQLTNAVNSTTADTIVTSFDFVCDMSRVLLAMLDLKNVWGLIIRLNDFLVWQAGDMQNVPAILSEAIEAFRKRNRAAQHIQMLAKDPAAFVAERRMRSMYTQCQAFEFGLQAMQYIFLRQLYRDKFCDLEEEPARHAIVAEAHRAFELIRQQMAASQTGFALQYLESTESRQRTLLLSQWLSEFYQQIQVGSAERAQIIAFRQIVLKEGLWQTEIGHLTGMHAIQRQCFSEWVDMVYQFETQAYALFISHLQSSTASFGQFLVVMNDEASKRQAIIAHWGTVWGQHIAFHFEGVRADLLKRFYYPHLQEIQAREKVFRLALRASELDTRDSIRRGFDSANDTFELKSLEDDELVERQKVASRWLLRFTQIAEDFFEGVLASVLPDEERRERMMFHLRSHLSALFAAETTSRRFLEEAEELCVGTLAEECWAERCALEVPLAEAVRRRKLFETMDLVVRNDAVRDCNFRILDCAEDAALQAAEFGMKQCELRSRMSLYEAFAEEANDEMYRGNTRKRIVMYEAYEKSWRETCCQMEDSEWRAHLRQYTIESLHLQRVWIEEFELRERQQIADEQFTLFADFLAQFATGGLRTLLLTYIDFLVSNAQLFEAAMRHAIVTSWNRRMRKLIGFAVDATAAVLVTEEKQQRKRLKKLHLLVVQEDLERDDTIRQWKQGYNNIHKLSRLFIEAEITGVPPTTLLPPSTRLCNKRMVQMGMLSPKRVLHVKRRVVPPAEFSPSPSPQRPNRSPKATSPHAAHNPHAQLLTNCMFDEFKKRSSIESEMDALFTVCKADHRSFLDLYQPWKFRNHKRSSVLVLCPAGEPNVELATACRKLLAKCDTGIEKLYDQEAKEFRTLTVKFMSSKPMPTPTLASIGSVASFTLSPTRSTRQLKPLWSNYEKKLLDLNKDWSNIARIISQNEDAARQAIMSAFLHEHPTASPKALKRSLSLMERKGAPMERAAARPTAATPPTPTRPQRLPALGLEQPSPRPAASPPLE